jgi:acyl-CoA synthetase (AMP-forming)/AMP-acid ligase II
LVPRPEAKINIEILKKYKPTFLPAVPTIFVGLLADPAFKSLDFSFMRGFFSGAAPLAADTIKNLKEISGKIVCKDNLAAYKVPKIIEFIDELPKSAVGKILRRKLKDMEMEKLDKYIHSVRHLPT